MNDKHTDQHQDGRETEDKKEIEKEEIGEIRHDEPVTVKDIARSLLMANEPEQRMDVKDSDSES